MSSRPTTRSTYDLPEHGAPRRWIPRLRDTRIRSKLALILVVPLLAVIALATVRLVEVGRGAYEASMLRSLTALAADVSALYQDVHKERMAAATFLADPGAKPDSYNASVRRTDERITAYRAEREEIGGVPAAVQKRLDVIESHLSTLNNTRQEVLDRRQMPIVEAVLRYGVILTDLVAYGDTLGQVAGEGDVGDGLRAAAAFTRAKAATAEEEAVLLTALSSGRFGEEQFSSFVATLTSQQEALLSFSLSASPQQRELVENTVTGDAIVLADRIASDVTRSVGQAPLVTAKDAVQAIGAVGDLMRWAEIRLEARLLDEAEKVWTDVLWQATVESVLVLIALGLAIALAVVLARSLDQALRRLREGALLVANHELPDAVSRLRDVGSVGDGGVEDIVRQVRDPIGLPNRDEIGQVALAFNVVHREAVRIAAEQAALRTSVSAMFLNLARRSQALVDRMIGELDMIERGEEDPKRLAQLFELDHLATRMRRNDENLLVLAGADSTAPRREDALLVDALRAAQSEVELYNRIEFGTVDTDISIAAHAVNDVVRLVAELLDNATRFSPPNTVVIADARRIRDYVLIQIEDRGLGLTDEQLDALNARLSAPPEVDVAAFRLMGLAVVSRLASRYGIRVELRRNIEGGTVAQVTLPNSTVVLPGIRDREPALSPARQPLAVESAPAATRPGAAAAFGQRWPATAQPTSNVGGALTTSGPASAMPSVPWPGAAPAVPAPSPATAVEFGLAGAAQPGIMTTHQAGMAAPVPPGREVLPQRTPGGTAINAAPAPTQAQPYGLPSGPVAGAVVPPPGTTEMPIFREMEASWFRTHGQDATAIFTMPAQAEPAATTGPAASGYGSHDAVTAQHATVSGYATTPSYASPPQQPAATGHGLGAAMTPPPHYAQAAPPAPPMYPSTPPSPAPQAAGVSATPPNGASPAAPHGGAGGWRTAADEGWAKASQAAQPVAAGSTRSGLPKRVPQAQLVPGGVEAKSARDHSRRTPDEVRGLLSAYHRGVQRARSAGSAQNGTTSFKETSG